ncbi:MAG: hypothetical protein JWP37_4032 [Mucilaginibacter sp.]|nr:hypothetical protein [Mucilaginibacter sp.]
MLVHVFFVNTVNKREHLIVRYLIFIDYLVGLFTGVVGFG